MRNSDDKIQDSDDSQISRLLGSLKRVEAPGDFGFRVKARIASARPSTGRGSWLPASVAVAAPLGLALAVGGYFTLTNIYLPATVSPPTVTDLKPAELPPLDVTDRSFVAESAPAVAGVEPETEPMVVQPREIDRAIVARPAMRRTGSHLPSSEAGGGSLVDTLGIRDGEIGPKGVTPNRRNAVDPTGAGINGALPAKDVLSNMGADANYSGSAWTVGSVKKGSSAERSGLKAGDVVEAIDGTPLSDKTSFSGKFAGKSIRIRREGKTVQIDLKH